VTTITPGRASQRYTDSADFRIQGAKPMPITGADWEIHIDRKLVQSRGDRKRTVGTYQVYHDGIEVAGLVGTVAECPGPGSNAVAGNKKRVEAGRYPLWTQAGTNYVTLNFTQNFNQAAIPRPGIELRQTGNRSEILIHPGIGFLSAVGCLNLCTRLPDENENISFPGSRNRVIAVIDDMKAFLGASFPGSNGAPIPRAWAVIDGEP
jgi:hypothetical protein